MSGKKTNSLCVLLALFLGATGVVFAQRTATISGSVADSSGAAVPGATIEMKNVETDVTQSVKSDGQGRYSVPQLSIGGYEVKASSAGFQTVIHKGITLSVGSENVVDFILPVGESQQTVSVTGDISQVETTSSAISNLVDQKQMHDLPLNGRNFQQLILLAPGVQVAQTMTITLWGKGDTYSIAGGRAEGMAMLLDSTDVMDFYNKGTGAGSVGTSLGMDAIAEFQTLTNTYGAQYGGQGGVINAVTKSGTNTFHGTAYEFLRNSALDARNFFDGAAPPPFRRNQFGAGIGGPIKPDKAFFYFNYEGLRQLLGVTGLAPVPDANLRQGIYQGKTYNLSPEIQQLLTLWPATSLTSATGVVNLPQVGNAISYENYFLGRFDYTFSGKDSLFARIVSDRGNFVNPFSGSIIPSWGDLEDNANIFATFEERHIVSPTIVNLARASFVRTDGNGITVPNTNPLLQWVPGNEIQGGTLAVTGLQSVGANINDPYRTLQYKYTLYDDLYWTKGAHNIKFGVSAQRLDTFFLIPVNFGGTYTFNSIVSFLQAQPFRFTGALPGQVNSQHWYREYPITPYINDDWKVTSKLTVNLGLRYEYDSNPIDRTHNITEIVNAPFGTAFTSVPNAFKSNPNTQNWDPRVGLAFDPFKDHKTSIRAGFGIFHNPIAPRTWVADFAANPPASTATVNTPPFPNPFAGGKIAAVLLTESKSAYSATTAPYMMQYNLSVQRELFKDTILTMAYVGSSGRHLFDTQDVNPPLATVTNGIYNFGTVVNGKYTVNPRVNPNFSNIGLFEGTNSNYNSLQVNLVHKFGNNFQAQGVYTWSHSIDESSGTYSTEEGGYTENPWNTKWDKGNSTFDVRHALRINGIYALPFRRNRFVQGWQISGIITATTGTPFSPLVGYDIDNLSGSGGVTRPNINPGFTADQIITGVRTQYINPAAFSLPAPGTLGNAGRDILRNPGIFDADVAFTKDTRIRERLNMQFRAELFNILNHTNFAGNFAGYGATGNNGIFTSAGINPSVGLITSTATTSRQIQFALRFSF